MKYLILISITIFSSIAFAQDTGIIIGKVLDKELANQPLPFASVTIKGTSESSNSDITGLFLFENLKTGEYKLVFNFPGYQSKELNVEVSTIKPTEIKLSLEQQTTSSVDITSYIESNEIDN